MNVAASLAIAVYQESEARNIDNTTTRALFYWTMPLWRHQWRQNFSDLYIL